MHNSYWYLALLLLDSLLFCFILIKKRNMQPLLVLLSMIGLAYIIETIIFNFLGSYDYHPKIIKHFSFYDSEVGAFVSNAFSLPVIATLIAVFHLNWIWKIIFSGLFVGIEWLFLKLHIYEHHWWKLAYTGFGLLGYFSIAKMFYKWIIQPQNRFQHYLLLYLITGSISASAHILPMLFFLNRFYRPGWFENIGRDSIAFAAIFYLCASLFYCGMVRMNWKLKWALYVVTGLLMFIVDQFLISVGILHSRIWWDQFYYVGLSLMMILLTGIVDRRLSKAS
ncbi:hypothetical protein BIV60_24345 [Bacillus sp. MUM 116]|uniref:hypothetical protein n=1 Tax=Bacillus sp. MUM 116 TaxID=1678002 RepID=UPI0008F5E4FF|nr:hypothetical protein [Bacillus sp. MUM 116]OIK09321.1 hypothetical protein BIV60_24345 [Bacillus sp. MUM 116]